MASEGGLRGVYFRKQPGALVSALKGPTPALRILAQTEQELEEYLAGKRKAFNMALDLEGTVFQKRVWAQLLRIPYGQTITYPELAHKIRQPKAIRAVGAANAMNPLSIVIPCHRVVSTSGELRGYSGGLAMKERLLALEDSMPNS